MNTGENGVTRGVGDFCAHFQRHKVIALARHDHSQSFCLQNRAKLPRHIEGKILFRPVTAHLPFVVAAVTWIQNHSLNIAHVWDPLRPHERLDRFGHVSA